jgi:ketosteroid isomerase-like protein
VVWERGVVKFPLQTKSNLFNPQSLKEKQDFEGYGSHTPIFLREKNYMLKLLCGAFLFTMVACEATPTNASSMESQKADLAQLKAINAQFIKNFLTQNAAAHDTIIHQDFVCVESNGSIVDRSTYLKNWATDFDNSGYKSFDYTDETIRIFGNIALVRAKTIYTKEDQGQNTTGYTIYTDTYLKENGQWKCIQVQITPIK